jgi:hypothetical protein
MHSELCGVCVIRDDSTYSGFSFPCRNINKAPYVQKTQRCIPAWVNNVSTARHTWCDATPGVAGARSSGGAAHRCRRESSGRCRTRLPGMSAALRLFPVNPGRSEEHVRWCRHQAIRYSEARSQAPVNAAGCVCHYVLCGLWRSESLLLP